MTTPPLPHEPRTFADQGSVARLNSARPAARDTEIFVAHLAPDEPALQSDPAVRSDADAGAPRVG